MVIQTYVLFVTKPMVSRRTVVSVQQRHTNDSVENGRTDRH